MKQQSELFELIKSLDKNEKRYFKLYASSVKRDKNYLKLFNAIDRQKTYDEAMIRKIFSGEKFIRQIGFTKNYLYNLIIKSLENYNSENSIDCRIHRLITQCKILSDKALFRQYFKTIQKVKKICLKYERFGYLLQVLDMEKMIIKKEEVNLLKADEIHNEAMYAMDQYKVMFGLTRIAGRLLISYREHGIARSESQKMVIDEALNDPLMRIPEDGMCYRAQESFCRVHEIVSEVKGDYVASLLAQKKRSEIVNNFPLPFEDYIIKFSDDILFSLVNTSLKSGMIDDAKMYLQQIKENSPRNKADEVDYNLFIPATEFKILMNENRFADAADLIETLEKLLTEYEGKILIDTELTIRFEIVKCLIMAKEYDLALAKANELLKHPLLNRREDYEGYLMVMNLVIHFELKNYDLLKYLIISTYRFLYKRKKLFSLESIILEFIRKLPEIKEKDDLGFLFHTFKKRLDALREDKYEKNAFEYFDFYRWVKEKSV